MSSAVDKVWTRTTVSRKIVCPLLENLIWRQTKQNSVLSEGLSSIGLNLIRACRYCVNLWCNHVITVLFLTNWAVPSWEPQYDKDSSFPFLATQILTIVKSNGTRCSWAVTGAVYPDVQFRYFTFMWPCIITNFFIIKPTRCTNFTNLFWYETLHVSGSSSVHHQKFIHCKLSNGICHTGLLTALE